MDMLKQLRAWGVAHAEAKDAEHAARQGGHADSSGALRRQAETLRHRADRLHGEIYRSLDRRGGGKPR